MSPAKVMLFALAALLYGQPADGVIRVEVSGLRNDNGKVQCALFSSAAGFPKNADQAVARVTAHISQGRAACEFSAVAPGTYAVSVFHDANGNGKMDTNWMGMPREGVGASNNPKSRFGPPSFNSAAVRFTGGRLELKITIHYL